MVEKAGGLTAPYRPTWEPLALLCGSCTHEWDDWQPTHCPVETWIAHVGTLHCPACGGSAKLFIRFDKPADQANEAGFGT